MNNKYKIDIGDKTIGMGEPVFIIAEAGVNHNGDIEIAKQLIKVAKEAGADAVKFQTFKTENIILPKAPKSKYHVETIGSEQTWYELLKTQELDRYEHEVLIKYCNDLGIIFLSTPYDSESADLLEQLGIPAFKISSSDANNIPFLSYIAQKDLPIILSTGMCNLEEVRESIEAIRQEGCSDLVLLHCTSNYPAELKNSNLLAITTLKDEFDILVGYSDHTIGYINPVASVALGSVVYEKHFTLDKKMPGPDHRSSLEPDELRQLVKNIRITERVLGSKKKEPTKSEEENLQKLRKSIVVKEDISPGTIIEQRMLAIKRPGTGLPPRYFNTVIGKRTKILLKKDTLIRLEDLE